MSRHIDADLIEYEPMCRARGNGMYEDCECAYRDQVDDIPTSDVRENITAHKVIGGGEHDGATCWFECSRCGKTVDVNDKYCSECGARFEA